MNTKLKVCLIGGALLAGLSATASARDNVRFSFSIGAPAYAYAPPPVYYAPPAPVVYYGPPVAPAYYGPRPRGYFDQFGRWHPYHPRRHYRNW